IDIDAAHLGAQASGGAQLELPGEVGGGSALVGIMLHVPVSPPRGALAAPSFLNTLAARGLRFNGGAQRSCSSRCARRRLSSRLSGLPVVVARLEARGLQRAGGHR